MQKKKAFSKVLNKKASRYKKPTQKVQKIKPTQKYKKESLDPKGKKINPSQRNKKAFTQKDKK